jgi:hypothetical protein
MRRDRLVSLCAIGGVRWWMCPVQHGVRSFASSTRANDRGSLEAHRGRGRLRHSVRSSKPGGWEPVAACHAAAAPRWATRRDTAAPTPNEIDQMSASRQRTPRVAGFSGGFWWRLTRQRAAIPRRHTAAAAAPDANANISHRRRCTSKSFPSNTSATRAKPVRVRIRRPGSTAVVGRPAAAQMETSITILSRGRRSGPRNGHSFIGEPMDQLLYCPHAERGMPE